MGALAGKDALSPIDALSEAIGSETVTEAVTVDTGLSSLTSDEDSFEEIDGGIAPQGLASVIAQAPIFIEDQICFRS